MSIFTNCGFEDDSRSRFCQTYFERIYYHYILIQICIFRIHTYMHKQTNKHREALGVLKKGDGDSTWEQAEKLFRKSVRKDPHYLPSYLSLIAMQLYRKEDHEAALLTIKKARAMFPTKRKNKELRDMELDARAMGSNLGHMVLAGSFASPYLGGAYKPAKTPKPPFAY